MGSHQRYICIVCGENCELVAVGPAGVARPYFMCQQHPDLFRPVSACCHRPYVTPGEISRMRTQPEWSDTTDYGTGDAGSVP